MRVHCLRHAIFEDEAAIGDWARDRGHGLTHTELFGSIPLPEPGDVDFLVVMGGPMNVYEEEQYPWLSGEKAFLDAFLALERPALGICLGAQLLADRLGGPVTRNGEPEIGWFDVHLTPQGVASGIFSGLPESFPALHWHGDTFAIPPGSVHAAWSEACANQAFVHQDKVLGLQFHLETTPGSLERMLRGAEKELVSGRTFIQQAGDLRRGAVHCRTTGPLLNRMLDKLTR